MTYTLTASSSLVVRDEDQAFIPNDPANFDWQDYQAWLDEGNEPNPAPGEVMPPIEDQPPPTTEELAAWNADQEARIVALEAGMQKRGLR
jgi:hypothetical protein